MWCLLASAGQRFCMQGSPMHARIQNQNPYINKNTLEGGKAQILGACISPNMIVCNKWFSGVDLITPVVAAIIPTTWACTQHVVSCCPVSAVEKPPHRTPCSNITGMRTSLKGVGSCSWMCQAYRFYLTISISMIAAACTQPALSLQQQP